MQANSSLKNTHTHKFLMLYIIRLPKAFQLQIQIANNFSKNITNTMCQYKKEGELNRQTLIYINKLILAKGLHE